MKLSKNFLTSLQQRLKVGNRSGVHLNAIPGRSRFKFDVSSLGKIWEVFPKHFLETLLRDPKFRFAINFDGIDLEEVEEDELRQIHEVAKRLNNLAYQVKDIELEKGINTFGFGYPLLIRRDHKDHKITVAPLIIWSLQIIQGRERNNWTIVKGEDDPIIVNEVLANHLESDIGIQLETLPVEIMEDSVLDKTELKKMCLHVLEKINHQITEEEQKEIENIVPHLAPIPLKKELEANTKQRAAIYWGGIFSIFETQKESIIKAYEELLLRPNPNIELGSLDNFNFQTISSVQTDPSQQAILNALKNRRNLVVHGPPGTGKSQTLTAIITNALENHKSILVVCEKRTALEVIYQNLKQKGLSELAIILRDEKKDRRLVVDHVRKIVDEYAPTRHKINASKANLQAKIDRCKILIRQINSRHEFINRDFMEDHNWTKIVGQVLEKRIKKEGTHFTLELNYTDWDFTVAEYQHTQKFLEDAEHKYQQVGPYLPSFFNLDHFTGDNPYALEDQMIEDFKKYRKELEEIKKLEQQYYQASGAYFYQQLVAQDLQINQLLQEISDLFHFHLGNLDFQKMEKTSGFFYQTFAVFSKNKKKVLADQQICIGKFNKLQSILDELPHFNYNKRACDSIPKIEQQLEDIKIKRAVWKASWPQLVDDHRDQLQKSVLDQGYPDLPEYIKYHEALSVLIGQINKDNWLKESFSLVPGLKKDPQKIEKKIKLAEDFFANPEPNFNYLFDWALFIKEAKPQSRALITLLAKQKNWSQIFSFHYLNTLLKNSASTLSVTNDHQYQNLKNALDEIEEDQMQFILKSAFKNQLANTLRFNQQNELKVKNLYNKRRSEKHERLSLRRIVQTDFELFTSFFPVILTSPTVACTLFYGMENLVPFDIVLFDEASQLRVEETLPALLKAQQKIIAGDEHQMPPSNYFSKIFEGLVEDDDIEEELIQKAELENQLLSLESLLEFAIDLDFDNYHLDFHYRSRHPHLIEFSNASFYQQRLQPMPAQNDYRPISFHPVNGTYESGVNKDEGLYILNLLDREIHPQADGRWPSVGIATFNLRQRNFLLSQIRERVIEDPAFAEKIKHLEEQGLFVKNLENIQGDERDIIILSTTYGKDKDEKFRQNFGPINHQKGYKLLNVIITRAKEKIFVCTSIDASYYTQYPTFLEQQGNNRRGVFYAYLVYAKAVSEGDEAKRQEVLNHLEKASEVSPISLPKNQPSSLFEQQVYRLLTEHFEPEELTLQFPIAGFTIDLVYQAKDKKSPPVAIECDGAWYPSSEEAYLNDLHRQKILEKQGFAFYRIWSTNWWRDDQRELNRLLAFLEEVRKRSNKY